jgi:hypothetical protein
VKAIYRREKLDSYLEENYFHIFGTELNKQFERKGISVRMIL